MKGQNAERLAGVLAQGPALAHLDLSGNFNFGAAGAENLAGVLGQCRELVHLNLSCNGIEAVGRGPFLRASWRGQACFFFCPLLLARCNVISRQATWKKRQCPYTCWFWVLHFCFELNKSE